MKKIFISLILINLCWQSNAQKSINLESIDLNFSPKKIFQHYENLRIKITEDIKILSSKIKRDKKNKEYIGKLKELISKKHSVNLIESYVWTIPIDKTKEHTEENSKEWLIEYDMVSHSTVDSTAYFKEVIFPSINFLEEPNGKFVALNTRSNNNIPTKKWCMIISNILTTDLGQSKHKNIKLFDTEYTFREWSNDELVYILISPTQMKGSIRFFIISKVHFNDLKGEFSEGSWLFLK